MSKSNRIEGPFTSEFGTFNPGDPAIAVTTCTKHTYVERVEYVGYIEREEYQWNTKKMEVKKYAQIRRPTSTFTAFWAGTDEKAKWPYGDRKVEYRDVPGTRISTLQYNRLIPSSASTDQLIEAL